MGGTLQSDLAWPSQGWTSPARDLHLSRSSRSSNRRSKIGTTSKMTPGRRAGGRTQVVGVPQARSDDAVSADSGDCFVFGGGGGVFDLREALRFFLLTINGGADSLSSCSG